MVCLETWKKVRGIQLIPPDARMSFKDNPQKNSPRGPVSMSQQDCKLQKTRRLNLKWFQTTKAEFLLVCRIIYSCVGLSLPERWAITERM